MAVVYQAINLINGKRYIGVTGRSLTRRMSDHFAAEKSGQQMRFCRAIRKYGRDMFRFSVLLECDPEDLARHEIRLIALLKPDYNATTGGDGSPGHRSSKKVRDTNRRIHTGNKHCLGRQHRPDTIRRLKSAYTNDRMALFKGFQALGPKSLSRKVVCVDTGEMFESASAAARAHGVARSALIELCLGRRGRRSIGGKVFKYASSE